jgi:hypothetical protein
VLEKATIFDLWFIASKFFFQLNLDVSSIAVDFDLLDYLINPSLEFRLPENCYVNIQEIRFKVNNKKQL